MKDWIFDFAGGHELHEVVDNRGRAAFEDDSLLIKSKKMRKSNPGTSTESNGRIGICSSKRKQLLEDVNLLKKLKISETNAGTDSFWLNFELVFLGCFWVNFLL